MKFLEQKKRKQTRKQAFLWFSLLVTLAALLILIRVGYSFGATGFSTKSLWDWMQLLVVPVVLAGGAILFNAQQNQTARKIASDQQHSAALRSYLDKMSELLLTMKLRESQPEDEIRKVARARTLTVMRELDKSRKGTVVKFLYEAGLIEKAHPIVDLNGADLTEAELSFANLKNADLVGANLMGADLSGTDMTGANLADTLLAEAKLGASGHNWIRQIRIQISLARLPPTTRSILHKTLEEILAANLTDANLTGAKLFGATLVGTNLTNANLTGAQLIQANLTRANLSGANFNRALLSGAIVTEKQLAEASSLQGTFMPNDPLISTSSHPY
jgi:hypothetical protein